jgi:tRNA(Ile)-lysidine synthase TilS/MesJ
MDTRKTGDQGSMDLELENQIEEILRDQMVDLESKVRMQLEEKALTWVEEECRKRFETLRENIREEIQQEVERWIEGELKRRMEEFKRRSEKI